MNVLPTTNFDKHGYFMKTALGYKYYLVDIFRRLLRIDIRRNKSIIENGRKSIANKPDRSGLLPTKNAQLKLVYFI